jgi:hypothetical protein
MLDPPQGFCEGGVVANQRGGQLVKCWHEIEAGVRHMLQRPQAEPAASPLNAQAAHVLQVHLHGPFAVLSSSAETPYIR